MLARLLRAGGTVLHVARGAAGTPPASRGAVSCFNHTFARNKRNALRYFDLASLSRP